MAIATNITTLSMTMTEASIVAALLNHVRLGKGPLSDLAGAMAQELEDAGFSLLDDTTPTHAITAGITLTEDGILLPRVELVG